MSPLPRGSCSVCGKDVALRRGGELREHRHVWWDGVSMRDRTVGPTRDWNQFGTCVGSGKPPRSPEAPS